MRLTFEAGSAAKLKKNFDGSAERFKQGLTAAANMAASMIQDAGRADIASAGRFGDEWTEGLHVEVENPGSVNNMRISMTHDDPRASIFEEGGTIEGNPLLWIPLSNTDAEGIPVGEYQDSLFGATSRRGTPLLFSMADKLPKYFGIESVTIPKKFHLREIMISVMANFRQIFDDQIKK